MDLKTYLAAEKLTIAQFAEQVGKPRRAVCNWVYGQRTPRLAVASKIEQVTGGKVTMADLLATAA